MVCSTPKTSLSQPHWKIATTTPNAAPIDSRFIAAAFSGTTIDRKITVRNSIDSPITTPMNHGSRVVIRSVASIDIAVSPPTHAVVPVPSIAVGSTVSRSRCTRSVVPPTAATSPGPR